MGDIKQVEIISKATGQVKQSGIIPSGVESITQTESTESGGINVITITNTDGRSYDFNVRNGQKGDDGATGPQGPPGDSFQPIEDVSGLVLAHTTGQDNTKAMSQKGVTDVFDNISQDIYDYKETGEYDETDLSNQITIGTADRNVNAPGGGLSSSQNYDASDYIDVGDYDAIEYSRAVSSNTTVNFGIAFYDENKTYQSQSGWYQKALSSSSGATDYTLTTIAVPEGAKYVRLSLRKASAGWSSPEIYGLNKIYNKTSKFIDIENEIQENADNIDNVEHEIYNYEKSGVEVAADLSSLITHNSAGYNVSSNGALAGGSSINDSTDFIDVGDYDAIRYSHNSGSANPMTWGIAFYAEDKSTLKGFEAAIINPSATDYVITDKHVPKGAK